MRVRIFQLPTKLTIKTLGNVYESVNTDVIVHLMLTTEFLDVKKKSLSNSFDLEEFRPSVKQVPGHSRAFARG